jgi:hypothetical protein
MSTPIVTHPEDPTAPMRQAKREAVLEVLQQLVRDTMRERTNALTRAVEDLMAQPPKDRWALDGLVTAHPSRDLVKVGRAFVRLAGEAWLTVADTPDQPC